MEAYKSKFNESTEELANYIGETIDKVFNEALTKYPEISETKIIKIFREFLDYKELGSEDEDEG